MGNKNCYEKIQCILAALRVPDCEHFTTVNYPTVQKNYIESTEKLFLQNKSYEAEKQLDLSFIKNLFMKDNVFGYKDFFYLTSDKTNPLIYHDQIRKSILLHLSNLQFLISTFPKFFNYFEEKEDHGTSVIREHKALTDIDTNASEGEVLTQLIAATSLSGKLYTLNRLTILSLLNNLSKEKLNDEKIILLTILIIDLMLRMPRLIRSEVETLVQNEDQLLYKRYNYVFMDYDLPSKNTLTDKNNALLLFITFVRHLVVVDSKVNFEFTVNEILRVPAQSGDSQVTTEKIYEQFIKDKLKTIKRTIFDVENKMIHKAIVYKVGFDGKDERANFDMCPYDIKSLLRNFIFYENNYFILSSPKPSANDIKILIAFDDAVHRIIFPEHEGINRVTLELNNFKIDINFETWTYIFRYYEEERLKYFFLNRERFELFLLMIEKIFTSVSKNFQYIILEGNDGRDRSQMSLCACEQPAYNTIGEYNEYDEYIIKKQKWMIEYVKFMHCGFYETKRWNDFYMRFDLKLFKINMNSLLKFLELNEHYTLRYLLTQIGDEISQYFDELFYDRKLLHNIPVHKNLTNRKLSIVDNTNEKKLSFTVYLPELTENVIEFCYRLKKCFADTLILCLPKKSNFTSCGIDVSFFDLILFRDTDNSFDLFAEQDSSLMLILPPLKGCNRDNFNFEQIIQMRDDQLIYHKLFECITQLFLGFEQFSDVISKFTRHKSKFCFIGSGFVLTFTENKFYIELENCNTIQFANPLFGHKKGNCNCEFYEIFSKYKTGILKEKIFEISYSKDIFSKWQDILFLLHQIVRIQFGQNSNSLDKKGKHFFFIFNTLLKNHTSVQFSSGQIFKIFCKLSTMFFRHCHVYIKETLILDSIDSLYIKEDNYTELVHLISPDGDYSSSIFKNLIKFLPSHGAQHKELTIYIHNGVYALMLSLVGRKKKLMERKIIGIISQFLKEKIACRY